MSEEFKIAVTYGGILGRFCRKLGLTWNHILIVQWSNGVPRWTYESNIRGVHRHPFSEVPDLAEEHRWYVAENPLNLAEKAYFRGFCDGACGKWYALHYWLLLGKRIIKRLLARPHELALIPGETCVTFVNGPCAGIGRPVSTEGASGLPDDIMESPHWKPEDGLVSKDAGYKFADCILATRSALKAAT